MGAFGRIWASKNVLLWYYMGVWEWVGAVQNLSKLEKIADFDINSAINKKYKYISKFLVNRKQELFKTQIFTFACTSLILYGGLRVYKEVQKLVKIGKMCYFWHEISNKSKINAGMEILVNNKEQLIKTLILPKIAVFEGLLEILYLVSGQDFEVFPQVKFNF